MRNTQYCLAIFCIFRHRAKMRFKATRIYWQAPPLKFIPRPHLYISTNCFILNRHCKLKAKLPRVNQRPNKFKNYPVPSYCTLLLTSPLKFKLRSHIYIDTNTGSLGKEVLLIRIGFLEVICMHTFVVKRIRSKSKEPSMCHTLVASIFKCSLQSYVKAT